MKSKIDDYLYEELEITDLEFSKKVQNKVLDLLLNNIEVLSL